MNTEQVETVTETVEQPVPVTEVTEETAAKRVYTRKEDMERGNQAILNTLGTDVDGALSKAQILTKLTDDERALVTRNWNLRIALLEETQQVLTQGRKVAKKYWRAV